MRFLSDEWLAALATETADLTEVPGCSVSLRLEVSGTPSGKMRLGLRLEDGRLLEASSGLQANADCKVEVDFEEALAMLDGHLSPAVAYMQGRLKLSGAYERVLFGLRPMLAGASGESLAALRRKMSDLVDRSA